MDWLRAAEGRMAEIEGEHNIQWVNCKAMVAIADALIAIAEVLRIMRNQSTFKEGR